MDTHPDDLSDLERRLAAWRPAAQGLDADAMLFAAGRASRPRRPLWPALTVSLAAVAVALGVWALRERSERLILAERLRQPAAPAPATPPPSPVPAKEPEGPRASSLLASRRALEHGLEAWPPQPVVLSGAPAPSRPALRAGDRNSLLDP